jgi:single-strand selective monofunctional uracil DNA glycosylase
MVGAIAGAEADSMRRITDDLVAGLSALTFGPGVTCVYNPLAYARAGWDAYLARAGEAKGRVLLLGMNPGPFGMAQIGVPFGDPKIVRDWLGIDGQFAPPAKSHPRRPILGFASPRTEVSGSRVWSWARDRFGTPQAFFERFFIGNYCPLCFLEESGRNLTPDKLPRAEREALFASSASAILPRRGRARSRETWAFRSAASCTRARQARPPTTVGSGRWMRSCRRWGLRCRNDRAGYLKIRPMIAPLSPS